MVLCRTIRGAILHCISSTKMVLNSTNSGSLAHKEPLKGLNRFFVRQWCYIAPYGSFPLSGTVQYSTVRYGTQLCRFPLSEVVNCTNIANRTLPLFWYPSVGVPSTARVELNSLQNVDWLTRIVTFAWYKGIKLLLHSFRSAVFGLLHQSAQTQKQYNSVGYFIILYFHTDNSRFLTVLVDLWNVIAQKPT